MTAVASRIAALPAGCRIRRDGSLQSGRAGGWLYSSRWREAVLLTSAHLLAASPGEGDTTSAVVALDSPIVICDAETGLPWAAVVESGRHEPRFGITSADAMLAVALEPALIGDTACVPGRAYAVRDAAPGDTLVMLAPRAGHGIGRVIANDWPSDHYGSSRDLLIEGLCAEPGDSGALLADAITGAPVALLVGDVRGLAFDGKIHERLYCAHHLSDVLRLFGGFEWLLAG
jgi:hypothetical protein